MFWFYIIVGLTLGVHSGVSIFIEVPYTRPNERIHTITIPLKTAPKDPTTPLQQPTQHQAPSRPLYEKKNKTTTKTAPKDSSAPPSTPPQNNTQGPTVALAPKRPNFKDPTGDTKRPTATTAAPTQHSSQPWHRSRFSCFRNCRHAVARSSRMLANG